MPVVRFLTSTFAPPGSTAPGSPITRRSVLLNRSATRSVSITGGLPVWVLSSGFVAEKQAAIRLPTTTTTPILPLDMFLLHDRIRQRKQLKVDLHGLTAFGLLLGQLDQLALKIGDPLFEAR